MSNRIDYEALRQEREKDAIGYIPKFSKREDIQPLKEDTQPLKKHMNSSEISDVLLISQEKSLSKTVSERGSKGKIWHKPLD